MGVPVQAFKPAGELEGTKYVKLSSCNFSSARKIPFVFSSVNLFARGGGAETLFRKGMRVSSEMAFYGFTLTSTYTTG